jgi:creatinine amidohydrolase
VRWEELSGAALEAAIGEGSVAILPLGAIEAHGPHLAVGADGRIAEAMAREGARQLRAEGVDAWVLPTLEYAPAPFAEGFGGTLSIRPETLAALVEDVAAALAARGVGVLALANAHFDPAQVGALRAAVDRIAARGRPRVAFPDLTRRRLAERLTEEFRSGACHGGRYETSILLAERPELVDEDRRRALPAVDVSLTAAMAAGHGEFRAAGIDAGYCGDPAAASAEEGRDTVARLGQILVEAVRAALAV